VNFSLKIQNSSSWPRSCDLWVPLVTSVQSTVPILLTHGLQIPKVVAHIGWAARHLWVTQQTRCHLPEQEKKKGGVACCLLTSVYKKKIKIV
jgi:hypothetical protein